MELPLLELEKQIIYPNLPLVVVIPPGKNSDMINDILKSKEKLLVAALKKLNSDNPSEPEYYNFGVAAVVTKLMNFPDESYRIIIQGKQRVKIIKINDSTKYKKAKVIPVQEINTEGPDVEALYRSLQNAFIELIGETPAIPQELKLVIKEISKPSNLADFISMHLNMPISERQNILEMLDVRLRLKYILEKVINELDVAKMATKIRRDVESKAEDSRREYYLREQLKAIKKELGEGDELSKEIEELEQKAKSVKLSEEARKACEKEIDRLKMMTPASAEYTVARTYLDWILELPWETYTEDKTNIRNAKKILDNDHYNLTDIKERILELIAVKTLKPDVKSPIICFVGPPGVGKTSLGQSIARALGRKFVRFSLGGIRDEAEIRGHRRTYVGALPGRIIQGIRRAESSNPLFMLDEIDKLGTDFRGDPASALLEVLDPEQNVNFRDHYLDLSFDLSNVLFIMTANTTSTIPPALLDRMEILELPGYTTTEKIEIAKRHLAPRQLHENGLDKHAVSFNVSAFETIIDQYTHEAGVRNLERKIAQVCRKIAKRIATRKPSRSKSLEVDGKLVNKELGPSRQVHEKKMSEPTVGVATGMAWTPQGGEILLVEVLQHPGKGELILTGQLGEVMKESAMAAMAILKANKKIQSESENPFEHTDYHIHVPAGAIPKDGPSAGITLLTALYSKIIDKPVRDDLAMTGEITLTGRVLPVGGIENKILAAKRAGIRNIILPKDNQADIKHISRQKKQDLKFYYVDHVHRVLKLAIA
ncbi:MAG: endopeptidase La [bacterium]